MTDGFQSFESFWAEYPKKVKRKLALDVWMRIRPTEDLSAQIVRAVKKQRAGPQWCREDGRFIPDPHKWLEGRQWEDEMPDPEPAMSLDDIRRRAKERKEKEND